MRYSLQSGMGSGVLAKLATLAPLPTRGIVAGQAVCSALLDLYDQGGGVYNDIDVFVPLVKQADLRLDRSVGTLRHQNLGLTIDADGYGGVRRSVYPCDSYSIEYTRRTDLVNEVFCLGAPRPGQRSSGLRMPLTAGRLIGSFDLNCTRVAVDLANGRLVWDNEFARFWQTRQLEVSMVHTPWHTFVRFLKKLNELPNVHGNVAITAQVVQAVAAAVPRQGGKPRYEVMVTRFGRKMAELAQSYRTELTPYFSLCEVPAAGNDAESSPQLWALEPRGSVERENVLRHFGMDAVYLGPRVIYARQRKVGAKTRAKLDQVQAHGGFTAFCASVQGADYVAGQVTRKHLQLVESAVHDHSLAPQLSLLSLADQVAVVRKATVLAGELGSATWAYLRDADPVDCLRYDDLRAFVEQEQAASRRRQVFRHRKLRLPRLTARWYGGRVEELTSPEALAEEGEALHHCVEGYWSDVAHNRCRILRIRSGPNRAAWSTAEVACAPAADGTPAVLGPAARLVVRQHKGFANQSPCARNTAILQWLVARHGNDWRSRLRRSWLRWQAAAQAKWQGLREGSAEPAAPWPTDSIPF